jgi:hypothetical protein
VQIVDFEAGGESRMSRIIGWFRELIEEPNDFSLETVLERKRAAARNPISLPAAQRSPLTVDPVRFAQHARTAPL